MGTLYILKSIWLTDLRKFINNLRAYFPPKAIKLANYLFRETSMTVLILTKYIYFPIITIENPVQWSVKRVAEVIVYSSSQGVTEGSDDSDTKKSRIQFHYFGLE